jgi:lantibiotic transport system permease protein
MEDKEEFLKQMENLNVPDIDTSGHQNSVKMAIMNAERSAALGVWLVIVPCYFLLCVLMYYYFHVHVGWFGSMFKLMSGLEKTPYIDFMGPLVLFVLPLICVVINVLAILHVHVQKLDIHRSKAREFSFTIRIKPLNILLIVISLIIVLVFINYVMTENISIKN